MRPVLICIFLATANSQNCLFLPKTFLFSGKVANVYLESDSKKCEESKPVTSEVCPSGLVETLFSSVLILPNGTNILPHIDLNITILANVFVSDIFVQLECLHATNMENTYCHDPSISIKKWGRIVWPCRQHSVKNKNDEIKIPFIFEHACFRMHGMSQYRIHITLKPHNCYLTYLVTIPVDKLIEPRIAQFFSNNKEPSKFPWSPMVVIDENEDDGLRIRFTRKDPGLAADICVALYNVVSGIATKEIIMEELSAPKSELKVNIPSGDYLVFVYVDDPNCKLHCPEEANQVICTVCPHTFLNFTLTSHKLSGFQTTWHTLILSAKYIFIVAVCLLLIAFIVLAGFYFYVRKIRPRRLARLPPQSFEMTANPDVLIIYTDDCSQHTSTVTVLAEILQNHANAKVRIDVFDLNDPSVKPSLWLLNSVSEARFVLTIFSNASSRVMAGESLIPRRPFPEMFNSAVAMVIAEINEITAREGIQIMNGKHKRAESSSALSKFLSARFVYSDVSCIPEFFNFLPCKSLVLPHDLGLLFAQLHGVNISNNNSLEHEADLRALNQAIYNFQQFAFQNRDWLDLRFEVKQDSSSQLPNMTNSQLPMRNELPPPSEMEALAERYNLINREEEEDGSQEDVEKYQLIGRTSDVSSISSGPN